ncbi:MAG TPA: UvrD-helicase domain-containing protein [Polyangiaceae bacterium]|nr:UvrD-helicase domain-containing protein [Polyangiaceae bacterium]
MTALPDAEARRIIREDLDATLIVEAAAGTGKTTELVARIVAVLREGRARLDQLVAVTFTEKAAGEMKLRLRSGIERARTDQDTPPEARARLDAALAQLEAARIGTIHALCGDLLRERPIEANVDPLFEVGAEDESERLFDQAFDTWFQGVLSDPGEGARRMLRRRPRGREAFGPRKLLRDAAWSLVNRRDFSAAWRRAPVDRKASIDQVVSDLRRIGAYAGRTDKPESFLSQCLQKIERFGEELGRREAAMLPRERDYDGLEAELREVGRWKEWRWQGSGQWFGPRLPRQDVLSARRAVKEKLDKTLEALDADLAVCLQSELMPLAAMYEELKARACRLDFLDLLLKARDLVRSSGAVREELQRRFTHIFVDEFQDTDPLQAELLLLLAADTPDETDWTAVRPVPGKLFLVGDPKQSIYRFRRADVALYQATKDRLADHGARVLHLTTSFRSAPSIQQAINAAFAPVMQGGLEGGQAEYVPLEPFRPDPEGRPTIVALPVPRPYSDWGALTDWKISESTPDAVGAFIDWLIRKSGWKVTEREKPTEQLPLAARHICILFKRFQAFREDITRVYVRALEARRIPHVLVGGKSFHAREEVLAIRNALTAIEWPDEELNVFATLRGPFFALTDDVLLAYRSGVGPLHPLRRAPEGHAGLTENVAPVAAALDLLARLHLGRNRRPIADTIARLLEATRAHAGIAIWPTGEQALANVIRVMDLARRFETSGATSFRAFVERMQHDAERGEAAEAPVVEEGTEGVRIMTVHRAKGLEFPVVILADPAAPATHTNPSRYVDPARNLWVEPIAGCAPPELVEHRDEVLRRDQEEAVRLTYVAATRARDLLVVPVVGDKDGKDEGNWLDVLYPVVYPRAMDRRRPKLAPGCPPFLGDSVLERPAKAEGDPFTSVAPGLHAPKVGTHTVAWWDPRALELDKEQDAGLRQQRILQADEGESASNASERAHAEWQAKRKKVLEAGAVPALIVRTPTEISAAEAAAARRERASREALGEKLNSSEAGGGWDKGGKAKGPLSPEEVARDEAAAEALGVGFEKTEAVRHSRPRGARFGTLVHAALAEVDFEADEGRIGRITAAQGRLLGAPADEIKAAASAVRDALSHPFMKRAAASAARGECRREVPVMMRMQDGTMLEGVVDLVFREEDAGGPIWTVIDFKSDAELAGRRTKYASQIKLYVDAVAAATGERARGLVLAV